MKVDVIYDADGTKEEHFDAHMISTQIFPGTTTCIVQVFDNSGVRVRTWQCSKVYTINKIIVGDI